MSRLPFSALAAFEAASRHGSMTRAADELGLTHGAISRQVAIWKSDWVCVCSTARQTDSCSQAPAGTSHAPARLASGA